MQYLDIQLASVLLISLLRRLQLRTRRPPVLDLLLLVLGVWVLALYRVSVG
jgi:hypothetical protein